MRASSTSEALHRAPHPGRSGAREPGQPQHQASPSGSSVEDVRVLIVDDHQCFADLLSCALSSVDGIDCVGVASSAVEGLRQAAELSPSVVVMDISMPGLDGLAATRQLRRASPGTAVAVVSAHKDREWIARAARAGASAYLAKGGPLTEMVAMLKAARPGPMVVVASLGGPPPAETPPDGGGVPTVCGQVRTVGGFRGLRLFGA